MKRSRPMARIIAAVALPVSLLLTQSAGGAAAAAPPASAYTSTSASTPSDGRHAPESMRWIDTWTTAPQLTEPHNMPPPPYTGDDTVLDDSTLRQTIRVTTGGERVRLSFSNEFGGAPLPLTEVSVALPRGGELGVDAIEKGSDKAVTFGGRPSVTVPVGARYVSDPLDLDLAPGTTLTVTAYLADGQESLSVTSHPGSRTTSHLARGNHVGAEELPDDATAVDHWYFLSGVEAWSARGTTATAVLGDSLTDGRGSTTNGHDRWPDQFFARLQAGRSTKDVAVLNQAAGGNRVLHDGLGPSALARLDRDVLARGGVNRLILFEGINDLGTAAATEAAQQRVAADLIMAYDQIVTRAHAHGIEVYGATLLPFGNNGAYDDPAGLREAARQEINEWIRTSGRFDAVLDFDRAVRDPEHPDQLLPALHDGDWLHLNPKGYGVLADTVPLGLFRG